MYGLLAEASWGYHIVDSHNRLSYLQSYPGHYVSKISGWYGFNIQSYPSTLEEKQLYIQCVYQ